MPQINHFMLSNAIGRKVFRKVLFFIMIAHLLVVSGMASLMGRENLIIKLAKKSGKEPGMRVCLSMARFYSSLMKMLRKSRYYLIYDTKLFLKIDLTMKVKEKLRKRENSLGTVKEFLKILIKIISTMDFGILTKDKGKVK